VETYAEPPAGTEEVEDAFTGLPVGTRLFTFDISNHRAPRLVDERPLGDVMRSVSISSDGTLLAADAAGDHAVYLVQLAGGVPDSVHKFAPSALSESVVESSTIHPSGDYVVTVSDSRYLHLFRVARTADGTPTAVTQVGDALDTGRDLSVGAFTADGNYFLIPDVGWGESALSFIANGRGRLLSVAFDFAEGDHRVVDEARVGRSPEGFALSPDERYAVTVDMRRTYLPARFPFNLFPRTRENSLTLLAFDAQTGELDMLDSQRFSGALPEDATFDSTGRNIAVAVYHDRADVYTDGYIEFWSVDESAEGTATLRRHDGTVPVVRGVHDLHSIP
jgi:WD40 repeat protein